MNGVPSAIARSWQASAARTSEPSVSGPFAIAPAEIVEQGDPLGIGADRDAIAHRLVDGTGGHVVGVEIAVARIHPAGDDQPASRREDRPDDRGVAWSVVGDADQRLDDAPALHLMVVLPDHPFLAANVERAEDLAKCGRRGPSRRRFCTGIVRRTLGGRFRGA